MIADPVEKEKIYTIEEYLELEQFAEVKHEYRSGVLHAMAGGTLNHGIIASNLSTEINLSLRRSGKQCTTFNSDVKVYIERFDRMIYPDVSVTCGELETNEKETVLKNPMLLIEVLSQSTKNHDRSDKFELYKSLPSFKEYVIVYQSIPKVLTWYKHNNGLWSISSIKGLDKKVYLHSIDAHLEMKYIYEKVRDLKDVEDIPLEQAY